MRNNIVKRLMTVGKPSTTSQSLFERYNHLLVVKPVTTKCITAGILAFVADIVCQTYFPSDVKDAKKPINERISWQRTSNFTLLNTVVVAPALHFWYSFLSSRIPGMGVIITIKRVVADQALFAPVLVPIILAGNLILEGKANQIVDKLRADWWSTLLANYSLWIPAQLINFSVIPPQFRVLWANLVGFFWNIYLSDAANKGIESDLSSILDDENKSK